MKKYIGTKTIVAKPMTRLEYNYYRGWEVPSDEDGSDTGYLVEYLDGGQSNHKNHKGYISWSPSSVFENAYQEQPGIISLSSNDLEVEERINELGLNALRVTLTNLKDTIKKIEIIRHKTESGSYLRFGIITMTNGFTVTGRPSVSVSAENDNDEIGTRIAIENAIHNLWQFVGYSMVDSKNK